MCNIHYDLHSSDSNQTLQNLPPNKPGESYPVALHGISLNADGSMTIHLLLNDAEPITHERAGLIKLDRTQEPSRIHRQGQPPTSVEEVQEELDNGPSGWKVQNTGNDGFQYDVSDRSHEEFVRHYLREGP